jgi:hypothetical protein
LQQADVVTARSGVERANSVVLSPGGNGRDEGDYEHGEDQRAARTRER